MITSQATKLILKQAKNDNLSHAYLIVGQENSSAQELFKDTAKSLKIQAADQFVIKAQDFLKINEVRQLTKKMSLRPHSSSLKLAGIFEASKLTPAAANALLKTLEEPPDHSMIMLFSEKEAGILPTIASRCQSIKVTEIRHGFALGYNLDEILRLPLYRQFQIADDIAKDPDCEKVFEGWLGDFLKKVKKDTKQAAALQKIADFQLLTQSNVNLRLLVENLFLSFQ